MYESFTFNLARDGLRYLIKEYAIKEMHIPYYLCDVVRHTLVSENCKPVFYHIDDNFMSSEDFNVEDFILYPNYWGICGENAKNLENKYPKLIVDNAHAFYDEPSGFACFNAGHKFGYKESFLWIKNDSIPQNCFVKNYDSEIQKRKAIFIRLHNKYKSINKLNIDLSSVPFVYPCLTETVEEADELVKELKNEGKIIYRYWNNLPKKFNEYKFYTRLVPIPIV